MFSRSVRHREAYVAIALIAVVAFAGCPSSDATNDVRQAESSRRPGDLDIVPREQVPDEYRPMAADGSFIEFADTLYDDGNPTHYADGSAAYLPDGTAIDYRPRNIQRELYKMPTLFIRDVGQARLGVEGNQARPSLEYLAATDEARVEIEGDPNVVWRDPTNGDICWRSLTCSDRECVAQSAEPLIFAAAVPGLPNDVERGLSLKRCPRCGRRDSVVKYHPPDTIRRTESLRAELTRLRAERQQK